MEKVEKLSMCRICLVENVGWHKEPNKKLKKFYEKLTFTPMDTYDCRPVLICHICYAMLLKCYQFSVRCVKTETMFRKMLTNDGQITKEALQKKKATPFFTLTPIVRVDLHSFETEVLIKDEVSDTDDDRESSDGDQQDDGDQQYDGHQLEDVDQKFDNHQQYDGDLQFDDHQQYHGDQQFDHQQYDGNLQFDDHQQYGGDLQFDDHQQDVGDQQFDDHQQDDGDQQFDDNQQDGSDQQFDDHQQDNGDQQYDGHQLDDSDQKFDDHQQDDQQKSEDEVPYDPGFLSSDDYGIIKEDVDIEENPLLYDDNIKLNIDLKKNCEKITPGARKSVNLKLRTKMKTNGMKIVKRTFKTSTSNVATSLTSKYYKCLTCPRKFKFKCELKSHKRIHAGGKPHKLIHTGEKPYVCKICELSFLTKQLLKRHAFTHRSDTTNSLKTQNSMEEEYPYKCSICQRTFKQINNLIYHSYEHTEDLFVL